MQEVGLSPEFEELRAKFELLEEMYQPVQTENEQRSFNSPIQTAASYPGIWHHLTHQGPSQGRRAPPLQCGRPARPGAGS